MSTPYLPRFADQLIGALFAELPALLLTGPRGSGKTTTALRKVRTVVRLDREAEAMAFRADPDAALRGLVEPVLLDEWQEVPGVLGAVKRAVDSEPRPARFILTGSIRADLQAETWPGTGRLVRLPMYGLTQRELVGNATGPTFLDRLVTDTSGITAPANPPDLRGYIELAMRGGYPEPALRLSDDVRRRWLESYVDQLLTRDAELIDARRDPDRLRRYFEAIALNTAGVVDERTLYDAASIDRKTASAYERLLRNLLVLDAVPAWSSDRLKRLVRTPKRYLVDAALVSGILRVDADAVLRDGVLLGRVLDTFVASQLRAELPMSASRPRLHHVRLAQGRHEVDLLAELGGGKVVAIEIKADAAPGADSAKHVRWLRDRLGERFVAGVVFHTGPRLWALDENIVAVPIAALWGDSK